MDDIPEAIRESISPREPTKSPLPLIMGGVIAVGTIGMLSIFLSSALIKPESNVTKLSTSSSAIIEPKPVPTEPTPEVAPKPPEPRSEPIPEPETKKDSGDLLGHLPYDVAPKTDLVAITADGRISLRQAAAAKFQQMQSAARAEGVILTPISAFRSIEAQDKLFFGIKEQRVQDATTRAEVSAPPGYSEHHTGYAIDIGDGNAPSTNVNPEFEKTAAFRWLEKNAARYSFELSFPPNNAQGVSYEPWHWRFVGDRHSLETFYKVRN